MIALFRTLPVLLFVAGAALGQNRLLPGLQPFLAFTDSLVALQHVNVIDGTGAAEKTDQTIVINGKDIIAAGASSAIQLPPGVRTIDLTGHTVIPGLVGMHEHLFYPSGGMPMYNEQAFSAPRLYLASGVTMMRTAGSLEPYTDLNVKRLIDSGAIPGPRMDATGPYIQGPNGFSIQMPVLLTPDDAKRLVDYWVLAGATSFKAYMNISHDALGAAIQAAHRHGLKITGHLCSVGFTEAAELGIDDLEHGLLVDTEFTPGKQQNVCPDAQAAMASVLSLDLNGAAARKMIRTLVDRKVAVTSTLSVFEASIPGRPPLSERMLDAMSPEAAESYLAAKERASASPNAANLAARLKKEMEFERAFVAAGGLLIAGCDPTGNGGALPGYGDQRNIELLVQAGFTPGEAIKIYSSNGAQYLGMLDRIGTVAAGKQADLAIIEGDPARNIADIERVRLVFKEGVAFDPKKLTDSVRGAVGIH